MSTSPQLGPPDHEYVGELLSQSTKPKGGSGEAQYFENCDAVRAAGLAPLTRGDGIYEQNTHMDRVACE